MTSRERADAAVELLRGRTYSRTDDFWSDVLIVVERAYEGALCTDMTKDADLGRASIVSQLREIITDQANDEGLWFDADRAPEAYLQRALRDLHGVVERAIKGLAPDDSAKREAIERVIEAARATVQHAQLTFCADRRRHIPQEHYLKLSDALSHLDSVNSSNHKEPK